jgi:hypothetical protein
MKSEYMQLKQVVALLFTAVESEAKYLHKEQVSELALYTPLAQKKYPYVAKL